MDNDSCKAYCQYNQDLLPNGHAFGSVTNQGTPVTVCIHKCDKDYPVLVQKPIMDNDSCKAYCQYNQDLLPNGHAFGSYQPGNTCHCVSPQMRQGLSAVKEGLSFMKVQ